MIPPPPPAPPNFNANVVNVVNNEMIGFTQQESNPPILTFMNIMNSITQMCIGAIITVSVIYASLWKGSTIFLAPSWFHTHIYLCVIGVSCE